MRYLKQSTEVTKLIGPFLDKTDGVTEESGLAGVATEISKNGAAFGAGPVLGTHDSDGWYPITLTTTHTNTIGDLLVKVHDAATHLPVWVEFHVLVANVYDSLFGAGTDKLDVNVEEWNTTSVPAEHTAGYPIVTIKDGTGTGEIDTTSGGVLVAAIAANAITATAIAADAITDAKVASDVTIASVTGSVGSVTATVPANVVSISGNSAAADNAESFFDTAGFGPILQRTTIATLASQTSFTLTAGSADNDAYNDCVIVIEDSATAAQKAVGVIDDYTGATKTVTLRTDPAVFTMAANDIVSILADRSLKPAVMNRTLDVNASGHVARVTLTDTVTTYTGNTVQTGDSFAIVNSGTHGNAALKTLIDAVDNFVDTEISSIISTLGTPAGASLAADLVTIDNFVDDLESRLGTPSNLGSGATISANLVDIEGQTDDIGTAGAGLTAIPWNASWDAEVQSEVQDAIEANNLDHLVKIAVDTDFATTVHLNSVVGHLADNGTSATFDRTTDSLEALQAEHDTTQTAIDAVDNFVDTEVAAIVSAIGTPSNLGGGATLAANLSDIEGQTDDIGAAGAGLSAIPWNANWDAEVQSEVDDALKASLAEGYRGTGAAGSVRDLLYEINQHLGESSITSTTKTLKKLDGSTTAKTYTLDSATTPTSISETT